MNRIIEIAWRRLLGAVLGTIMASPLVLAGGIAGAQDFKPGPLGAVAVGPGEAIQIRTVLSMSTLKTILGTPSRRAVELAVADVGPVHGRAVALGEPIDSRCGDAGGRDAARAAVAVPKIVGLIGTSCSVAAAAAAAIISNAGLVMISPTNTAPSLTSDLRGNAGANRHAGYYRTAPNDLQDALAVAHFAYGQLDLGRVAAIHDGDPYTMGLVQAFKAAFEALGGAVTVAAVDKGATDMAPVLARLAAAKPDGVFLPLFPAEAGHVIRQARAVPGLAGLPLIGGNALPEPEFLAIPESAGMYISGPPLEFPGTANEATGRDHAGLLAAYRDRWGEEPESAYFAHAYDAATLLLHAIAEVAVAAGDTLHIDRAALRARLTAVSGFRGITGEIGCDAFGDCAAVGLARVYRHGGGGRSDLAVVYSHIP